MAYTVFSAPCASLPLCILFSFSVTPRGSLAAPCSEGVCGAGLILGVNNGAVVEWGAVVG